MHPARSSDCPGESASPAEGPTWSTFKEAIRVFAHRPFLTKTTRTSIVVGSILFSINHLDEVLRGQAHAVTWIKRSPHLPGPFRGIELGNPDRNPPSGSFESILTSEVEWPA